MKGLPPDVCFMTHIYISFMAIQQNLWAVRTAQHAYITTQPQVPITAECWFRYI